MTDSRPPVSGEPSSLRYTDAARTRVHEHCGDCSDWACDGFEARATPPDEGRDRLEAALRDVLDSLDRAYGKRLGPGATTFRPRARAALGEQGSAE